MQRGSLVEEDLPSQPLIRLVACLDRNASDLLLEQLAQGKLLDRRAKADDDPDGFLLCDYRGGSRERTQRPVSIAFGEMDDRVAVTLELTRRRTSHRARPENQDVPTGRGLRA